MNRSAQESAFAYGVALASLAVAVLFRWLLDPGLGQDVIGLFLYLVSVSIIIYLGESLRRARQQSQQEEAQNHEFQQQIATTLESVTDGFMRYDRDWRIVYVNAEAERINRLARSEMLGRNLWEVFPALVGTVFEAEFRRAVTERTTVEFENHYEPFGRWYSLKGYPTADGGLTTFIRDITEHKYHQEALQRSEARLRRVFESNVVGMIRWDLERSLILDANDTFLQMTGYARDDVAAGRLNFRDMTPAEWTPRNEEGIRTIQTEGHAAPYEKEYFRKDGSRVPLIIAGTRFDDSPAEGMSILIDISASKRAEQEVARLAAESERQRRLYETVLTNTPDFVYVFSLDHKVLYANDALIKMWGRGYEGAIGKTFLEIGYERWHAEMHAREIDQVRATRLPIRGEVPFNGTNGRREYDYIFVPVFGDNGEVEAVAGTTRDVTERKQTEAERERLVSELKDQDRRKDEFLATLAHELRNPLAPIRNGLHIMQLAGANGTIEQARAMMERQTTQLIRLVDDLLDVSRVTSGKLELRRERLELRAVIDAAVETSRPLMAEAGHELNVVIPDGPILVDGDATRLAQVVSNLLNNSAKYTHRGGHVRLVVRREDDMAVVVVVDDGIGIPSNMLGKVFEMFTQVDRALEKTTGGLGIGLSLVKGIVEMHGGTIEARSDGVGLGSEFIVRLPVLVPAVQKVEPPDANEPVRSSSRRILIADDNVDSADSLGQLLELLGNNVNTVNDGLQAVEVAERFRPEVILLDIGMPKLNGYEACRRIREQPWAKNALIVAMTGWGQEEDKRRSHEAGFDVHLVKPVNFGALEKLLSSLKVEPEPA